MVGPQFADVKKIGPLLECLKTGSISKIDTAARYPPGQLGLFEQLLGRVGAATTMDFRLDRNILMGFNDGSDELSAEAIAEAIVASVTASLKRLQTDKSGALW